MKLHSVVDGEPDGPVLVLSNSLGTTLEMWETQLAPLGKAHRLVRYDQRGHGGSPVPPGPYTLDDLGGDLLELLDSFEAERVSLCGLSIGGLVGIWLAVNAPERLDRLVLACTRPAFPPPGPWLDRAATVRSAGVASIADSVLARWFTPSFEEASPATIATFRTMLTTTAAEGYAACCEALAAADLSDALSGISAPTLVLTGSDDPVAPPRTGADLAAAIPGARHAVVAGAAHIANVERPAAFTALLLEHLTTEATT